MIDLTTTNVLLGIMAAVSLLEALALIGAGVMGLRLYRQLTEQMQVLETRHVQPLRLQAEALSAQAQQILQNVQPILQTVNRIADRVEHSTNRVDAAVDNTVHRAEVAVDRVHGGVRKTAGTVIGVVRGMRTAIETFLTDEPGTGGRAADAHASSGNGYAEYPSPRPPASSNL
jgi:uncharacterized protein YoxC